MEDGELYFYIKDYQGNVRVVLDQRNQPVELNAYYLFGMLMAATPTEPCVPMLLTESKYLPALSVEP